MGIKADHLNRSFRRFIEAQPLFFVATAAPEGRVNLSPKGWTACASWMTAGSSGCR